MSKSEQGGEIACEHFDSARTFTAPPCTISRHSACPGKVSYQHARWPIPASCSPRVLTFTSDPDAETRCTCSLCRRSPGRIWQDLSGCHHRPRRRRVGYILGSSGATLPRHPSSRPSRHLTRPSARSSSLNRSRLSSMPSKTARASCKRAASRPATTSTCS